MANVSDVYGATSAATRKAAEAVQDGFQWGPRMMTEPSGRVFEVKELAVRAVQVAVDDLHRSP